MLNLIRIIVNAIIKATLNKRPLNLINKDNKLNKLN
jgi:hypothetical protein